MAPVHHQIVEQVSLCILGAGSPGTHKIIKSMCSIPQLIVLPQSSPVPGEIKDLLWGCLGRIKLRNIVYVVVAAQLRGMWELINSKVKQVYIFVQMLSYICLVKTIPYKELVAIPGLRICMRRKIFDLMKHNSCLVSVLKLEIYRSLLSFNLNTPLAWEWIPSLGLSLG